MQFLLEIALSCGGVVRNHGIRLRGCRAEIPEAGSVTTIG
jgi:hypothetical protein